MSDDTSASVSSIDPIALVLPPRPELSRVARLASSALASIAGCTVDEIEDIKIAVSEILIALIEHGEQRTVRLEFSFDADTFVVVGTTVTESFDLDDPDLGLCRTVLEGVGATPLIAVVDGTAWITASVARTITN